MQSETKTTAVTSTQISVMGVITNIGTKDFGFGGDAFLIKNDTYNNVSATIVLEKSDTPITTILSPGWNPELVRTIKLNAGLVGVDLKWGR